MQAFSFVRFRETFRTGDRVVTTDCQRKDRDVNAYVIHIPETRSGRYEPPEPWIPTGIFRAHTRGQAKFDALMEWSHQLSSGVYGDDWTSLRVRSLGASEGERGEVHYDDPAFDELWGRAHEVLDHGRLGLCDCPTVEVVTDPCERDVT